MNTRLIALAGLILALSVPALGLEGVATYWDDLSQAQERRRIYVFTGGNLGRLAVNYWNGLTWQWADQGKPQGGTQMVIATSGVIEYRNNAPQRIYAFARGSNDGKLYVNYWDGSQWQWADQGKPPGTTVDSMPGVVTYADGSQRIYAFVKGADGRLYVNYWNGSQWQWADQGVPQGTTVIGHPTVITYREDKQPQRIYVFVRGADGNLHVNYWNGSKWQWANQGKPPGGDISAWPSAITYREGTQPQRIYVFVVGNNKLYTNYWDGSQWQWANQGNPSDGQDLYLEVGATTYQESAQPQRIYAFVRRTDGHLWVNYWNGSKWQWANQGKPPGTSLVGGPAVTTYQDPPVGQQGQKPQRIYAFLRGENDHLWVNYWNGSQWQWADQGTPPP
jgi:hypothetical protein